MQTNWWCDDVSAMYKLTIRLAKHNFYCHVAAAVM